MSTTTRFRCPSFSLSLKTLLKPTRKALWAGLLLALGMHLLLTQLRGLMGEAQRSAKPLTTRFIKREPRLSKPLEMKKRPQPKRRMMHRKMVSLQAKVNRQQLSSRIQPIHVIQNLAKPQAAMRRSVYLAQIEAEPEALAQEIMGIKQAESMVDMSLELVDVEALDTGRYQAMVIQDPLDKRKIKGFFHFACVYSTSIHNNTPARFQDLPKFQHTVVNAMNRFTDIETTSAAIYSIDSKDLLHIPWIFMTTHYNFKLRRAEVENLGEYLVSGGFLVAEPMRPVLNCPGDIGLRNMIIDALETQDHIHGRDWDFEKLPNDHLIYHCYYDFQGPPPGMDHTHSGRGIDAPYDYLEGVTIEGRLVAIASVKDLEGAWDWWPEREGIDNTRQLQFLVNLIVFALTQEGSITNRVMDIVGR